MSAAIGWALVHFLWQGALIALLSEAVLAALQNRSAELRYTVRCTALAAMALAPVITFAVLAAAPQPPLPRDALVAAVMAGLEPARGLAWTDAVVVAWSLGASFFAARLLRDWLRVRRLQSIDAGGLLPLDWQVRFDDIAELLQVKAIGRVVDSASLAAPTVIGWMKPVVLVPARVLTGLSQDQVEALLAHELAHVRRHDYLVNLVQSAVEALLFYHPAVWWVSNGIRAEREFCCDDVALRVTHNRLSYARALTTLEEWRGAELQIAMSTLGGPLMQRIQRMVGVRRSNSLVRGPLAAFAAMLVLGCAASAFGHDPATPQDADQIRAIQAEIEQMEARLAELKSQLARTMGDQHGLADEGGNVWVERIHVDDDDVHVTTDGKHNVFRLKGDGLHGIHKVEGDGQREVYRFEGDGAEGEIVVEIHGNVEGAGKSHGMKLRHEGHAVGIGSGEGNVIIEVLGEDGEPNVIKRRFKIGGVHGGSGNVFKVREGDGEGNIVIDLQNIGELEKLHEHNNQLLLRELGESNTWQAGREQARVRLHAEDLEDLHEQLRQVEEIDMQKLHEHLRHVEEIDMQELHEHLMEALEGANVQVRGLGDNVRVLKLKELGELHELEELEGLEELHELHLEGLHGAGHSGDVRVLRLRGDGHGGNVRIDVDDDLLEKVRKARVELLHEHGTKGEHHPVKQPKQTVSAGDTEIV